MEATIYFDDGTKSLHEIDNEDRVMQIFKFGVRTTDPYDNSIIFLPPHRVDRVVVKK